MRERERELHPPLGVGTPRDPTSLSALAQNLENDGNSRRPNTSVIWNNRDVMIYKSYILHSNLDIVNKSVRTFLFTILNNSLYQM